ncbi:MAG: DUF4258 domain-containing protein [Candidatus Aenigmarchaeota archaeon]|nr:DUF4258 domain-containing protein [Candidatus Aenigmarchaeota archaeon]
MKCSFRPSTHTKVRMISRGIEKKEIIEAILNGPKRVYEDKIITTYKNFEVIYKQLPCNYFVITVYWKS